MSKRFAYLLVVRFTDIECKYLNHFISGSKCREIRGASYDNGRIYKAKELVMTLTDVDFYFILDTHKCDYIIEEIYFAKYVKALLMRISLIFLSLEKLLVFIFSLS